MSYCRFSTDSDLYVYRHIGGFFRVHTDDFGTITVLDRASLIAVMDMAVNIGLKVPVAAIDRLLREIESEEG